MCGIAGFSISDKDHRVINTRKLAKRLALQIQARGRDATGIAWSERDDNGTGVWYMKDAIAAADFVRSMDQIPQHTRSAIIHTRYATKGSPENNANNHPILVGETVGIHNGQVRNDDELIEFVGTGRTAQVDSEAIFRVIDAYSHDMEATLGLLDTVEGTAAIAWFNTTDAATIHLCRICGSPLFIGTTPNGSMVFASLEYMVRTACRESGVTLREVRSVPEGLYLQYRHGVVTEVGRLGSGKLALA